VLFYFYKKEKKRRKRRYSRFSRLRRFFRIDRCVFFKNWCFISKKPYLCSVFHNTRLTYTATVKLGDEPGQAQYAYTAEGIYDYDPYGKILRSFIKSTEKYLTTGHERDTETDLDYRGARFYDSEVVRFLSLDPLAHSYPSLSPYNYVGGNPLMFIDPTGAQITGAGVSGVLSFFGGMINALSAGQVGQATGQRANEAMEEKSPQHWGYARVSVETRELTRAVPIDEKSFNYGLVSSKVALSEATAKEIYYIPLQIDSKGNITFSGDADYDEADSYEKRSDLDITPDNVGGSRLDGNRMTIPITVKGPSGTITRAIDVGVGGDIKFEPLGIGAGIDGSTSVSSGSEHSQSGGRFGMAINLKLAMTADKRQVTYKAYVTKNYGRLILASTPTGSKFQHHYIMFKNLDVKLLKGHDFPND
jgi:RHS repeat-associated protein